MANRALSPIGLRLLTFRYIPAEFPLAIHLAMPTRTYSGRQARIPFHASTAPTLGVEIELQIVDPETMNLVSASQDVLRLLPPEVKEIKPELTQSTIEVITGICKTVKESREDLRGSIKRLYEIGEKLGITYAGFGSHPFAQWKDQDIFPNERYVRLVERIQWPARRLMIYGLHVHVGVGSGEKAIAIGNALTVYLPHMLALSASSPFIDLKDTGLASARAKIFEGMPTAGLPYRLGNYGEFQAFMNTLLNAGTIESIREIWWDIRPHPDFGTIEVRICDCPATLWETAAITAFIQCLVVRLDHLYDDGVFLDLLAPWVIRENKWRSVRFGLDAQIITDNRGRQAPLKDEILRMISVLDPVADQLDCAAELHLVADIVRKGASSERQRAIYAEVGNFPDLVCHMANEFRQDVFKR